MAQTFLSFLAYQIQRFSRTPGQLTKHQMARHFDFIKNDAFSAVRIHLSIYSFDKIHKALANFWNEVYMTFVLQKRHNLFNLHIHIALVIYSLSASVSMTVIVLLFFLQVQLAQSYQAATLACSSHPTLETRGGR